MLRRSPREDQDVVEVDHDGDIEEIPQHVVDQGLENSWGVSQPERHDEVLKVTQVSIKPRLPFVPLSNTNQMVRVAQVELSEDGGVGEWLECGTEQREGIPIPDCDSVELPVIDARPQAAVLLRHKEKPGCDRGKRTAV